MFTSLKMPNGAAVSADAEDMFVYVQWVVDQERRQGLPTGSLISTILGHPTYINTEASRGPLQYWKDQQEAQARALEQVKKELAFLDALPAHPTPDDLSSLEKTLASLNELFKSPHTPSVRATLAKEFNAFYGIENSYFALDAHHVIATNGGGGALHTLFQVMPALLSPSHYYATPFPRYILYSGAHHQNHLHPIHVMEEPGHRFSPAALRKSLAEAKQKGRAIGALLWCNPNNPLGTAMHDEEYREFVEILSDPENSFYLIIDEAYIELSFDPKHRSFLSYLASEHTQCTDAIYKKQLEALKDRLILLRSGTKGLSLAGERLAAIMTFSKPVMRQLKEHIQAAGAPARSLQMTYANAIKESAPKNKKNKLAYLQNYYRAQVNFVENFLKENQMDAGYNVEGTFYVLCHLRSLLGFKVEDNAVYPHLKNKTILNFLKEEVGLPIQGDRLRTDKEIAYYLLTQGIAITPLSFFETNPEDAYFRITCSGGKSVLKPLLDKLRNLSLKTTPIVSPNLTFQRPEAAVSSTGPLTPRKKPQPLFSEEIPVSLFSNFFSKSSFVLNTDFAKAAHTYWEALQTKAELYLKEKQTADAQYKQEKEKRSRFFKNLVLFILNQPSLLKNPFTEKSSLSPFKDFLSEFPIEHSQFNLILEDLRKTILQWILFLKREGRIKTPFAITLSSENFHATDLLQTQKHYKEVLQQYEGDRNKAYSSSAPLSLKPESSSISDLVEHWIRYCVDHDIKTPCSSSFYSIIVEHSWGLIEIAKKSGASIPYGDVEGNFEDRIQLAEAFNTQYHLSQNTLLNSEHVIFFGTHLEALIQQAFGQPALCYSPGIHPSKLSDARIILLNDFLYKSSTFDLHSLIIQDIKKYTRAIVIIDESLIELELLQKGAEYSLFKELCQLPDFQQRVVLVRSASGIFSTDRDRIATLVCYNKDIREKFLEASFNMQLHPPRSLQSAYAKSLAQFSLLLKNNASSASSATVSELHLYAGRLQKLFRLERLLHLKSFGSEILAESQNSPIYAASPYSLGDPLIPLEGYVRHSRRVPSDTSMPPSTPDVSISGQAWPLLTKSPNLGSIGSRRSKESMEGRSISANFLETPSIPTISEELELGTAAVKELNVEIERTLVFSNARAPARTTEESTPKKGKPAFFK